MRVTSGTHRPRLQLFRPLNLAFAFWWIVLANYQSRSHPSSELVNQGYHRHVLGLERSTKGVPSWSLPDDAATRSQDSESHWQWEYKDHRLMYVSC